LKYTFAGNVKEQKLYMTRRIFILLLFAVCTINTAHSQNIFRAIVKDSATHEIMIGVTAVLKGTTNGASSNTSGELTIHNIPDGEQTIVFSFIGYKTTEQVYFFPLANMPVTVLIPSAADELEEVIIEGTRSNKSIENIPTRVEVLTEEIDEASTMDPSKIAHLITHSTGIQVQQTSATSNTANVRIQGLDGRYTQILKDGFPLYGGFSGSLSIMQIPPLDLRQVEYIKGGASTLYGGGAISGLINLISKEPTHEETLLHLNGSHIGAFDVNAYMSRKIGKMGFTLLGQRNAQKYFDADDDGFSDVPQLIKYNLNPKVFFYFSDRTKLSVGGTFTEELRQGGDVKLMNHEYADTNHFYKEVNDINRITTQLKFDHKLNDKHSLTVRNSFNIFHRGLEIIPSKELQEYRFAGSQLSSFSEVAYTYKQSRHLLITGLNFYSDDFREDRLQSTILRNEEFKTIGAFANYNIDIGKMVALEAGFRGDYVFEEKLFVLPRVAILFKWTDKLTTRVGGGMGYRNPTIFNQEAELLGYQNVLPIDKENVKAEQSYGGNIDIGFKTPIGDKFFININQMFFYTYLDKPVVISDTGSGSGTYHFINANGFTNSFGGETFFKFGFYDFVLFAGYTYTNATNHFNDTSSELTLTPQHSLKGDLLYALPGKWRIGLDYEFKSSQTLSNGVKTKSYWTYGAVVEYTWQQFTFFGNVENYTNVRQTNFGSLKSAPHYTPQFTEVWAPLDGIVFNTGLKVRL
jgi:outer membrane receptor for ferrienterochelin and colicins